MNPKDVTEDQTLHLRCVVERVDKQDTLYPVKVRVPYRTPKGQRFDTMWLDADTVEHYLESWAERGGVHIGVDMASDDGVSVGMEFKCLVLPDNPVDLLNTLVFELNSLLVGAGERENVGLKQMALESLKLLIGANSP